MTPANAQRSDPTPKVELTMLNNMAGEDIAEAITRQRDWGIHCLDLKDHIFARSIADLDQTEGQALATLVTNAGLRIQTLSTGIGYASVEKGEAGFRADFADQLDRICALVPILRPTQVRLLAAKTDRRAELSDAITYIGAEHAWLFPWYQEAFDRLTALGTSVVIENEVGTCCLSRPQEILDFVAAIDRPELRLIWDVVNLWQMGTYPSVAVYRQLSPVIGMLHLKGGRSDHPGGSLRWRSDLATASWPLREVMTAVLADHASPVVCLNPPHGAPQADYRADPAGDLAFLRSTFPEFRA